MKQSSAPSPSRPSRGFTLIELMVVVAVLGILVAIAVPSYQDSVRKSRRGQAKADLIQIAQGMERHFTNGNTYVGADLNKIWGPKLQSPSDGTARYTISFQAAPTATTFTLQAVPVSGGGQERDKCGTLSVDNLGRKKPGASDAGKEECWNMN